ncbi:MAG TPA: DUF805 domain-containing protein, partial [Devosiaceae bacterium]|nr:DUF805 domain-containing protein [Devosiaceae bacterium]
YIVVGFILGSIFGVQMFNLAMTAINDGATAESITQMAVDATRTSGWVSLITLTILAYPGMALWIKRSHDRDTGPNLIYALYGLMALSYLLQGLGMTMSVNEINGVSFASPNTIGWILSLATGILGLYLLVTLGFLKGTDGPNQYGPDPLGGGGAAGTEAA